MSDCRSSAKKKAPSAKHISGALAIARGLPLQSLQAECPNLNEEHQKRLHFHAPIENLPTLLAGSRSHGSDKVYYGILLDAYYFYS